MVIFRPGPTNGLVEYKKYEKIAIFDQYLALCQKQYKVGPQLLWNAKIGNRTKACEW